MILFRILFNLFGLGTRLLFLPVHLLMRNMFLVLIVIVAILLYRAFDTNSGPTMVQPAAAPSPEKANPAGAPGHIDPVRRHEDGDSAFATDLYASMSEPERNYYSQMFFSVMSNVADNTAYPWADINISGTITPTQSFENNDGATCRNFKEVLKVHSIEQTVTGTACTRLDGGWCKLKLNATPACGLGNKNRGGIFDSIRALF